MSEDQIWLNGALRPAGLASISAADRGFTLGDGLFETIRVVDSRPRHTPLHLARLRRGAAQLNIEVPFDDAGITAAFTALLTANNLREAVLRLTLTRGVGPRGLAPPPNPRPTLLISATTFIEPPPDISAIICRMTRRNAFSPLATIKSLNYLDNIIARQEALRRGAEEAILLNTQGDVAEATTANLFLYQAGKWLTPRAADGALPGIFRARLLAQGMAREVQITQGALFSAESICLGNALGVQSIATLDEQPIAFLPEPVADLRKIFQAED